MWVCQYPNGPQHPDPPIQPPTQPPTNYPYPLPYILVLHCWVDNKSRSFVPTFYHNPTLQDEGDLSMVRHLLTRLKKFSGRDFVQPHGAIHSWL